MDPGLCLSEEHGSSGRDGQRALPTVRKYDDSLFNRFCCLLYLYCLEVNGEDTSEVIHIPAAGQGEPLRCPKVEAIAMGYLASGHEVYLAMSGETAVGFTALRAAYDCLLLVRALYVMPDYQGMGLVKSLYLAAAEGRQIDRVFFQTRADREPAVLLHHTDSRRRLVQKNGNLLTWEMSWGAK